MNEAETVPSLNVVRPSIPGFAANLISHPTDEAVSVFNPHFPRRTYNTHSVHPSTLQPPSVWRTESFQGCRDTRGDQGLATMTLEGAAKIERSMKLLPAERRELATAMTREPTSADVVQPEGMCHFHGSTPSEGGCGNWTGRKCGSKATSFLVPLEYPGLAPLMGAGLQIPVPRLPRADGRPNKAHNEAHDEPTTRA